MNQLVRNKQTQLHEALKQYLAFLETRGLVSRTEEIPSQEAIGRVSASATYGGRHCDGRPAGEMILQSFLEIEPAMIAALLAGGVRSVSVLARPRVGIIFTDKNPDRIRMDSGGTFTRNPTAALYCAMLARWGAEGVVFPCMENETALLQSAIQHAAEECDLVLLCTDAKVRDLLGATGSIGETCIDGIAIQPGGDALLGAIDAKPVICLPGDPVSGMIVLEELAKPVLDRLLMRERTIAESVCVKMGSTYASATEVREFVRARLGFDSGGNLSVLPIPMDQNGIEPLAKADCILDVPVGCAGYAAGERAHVHLLKPIDRIARTVRICGNCDPFLDEAADALRRADIRAYVSTECAGNEDAMLALCRGECHLCSILLKDESDGLSYIAQHIPDGGAALVEGVTIANDNQTYDLLVSLGAMEHPQVRALLRALGSEPFLRRLDALGGYRYDKPGRIKKIWREKLQEPETEPKTGRGS